MRITTTKHPYVSVSEKKLKSATPVLHSLTQSTLSVTEKEAKPKNIQTQPTYCLTSHWRNGSRSDCGEVGARPLGWNDMSRECHVIMRWVCRAVHVESTPEDSNTSFQKNIKTANAWCPTEVVFSEHLQAVHYQKKSKIGRALGLRVVGKGGITVDKACSHAVFWVSSCCTVFSCTHQRPL